MKEKKDPFRCLLDERNTDDITMYDENNNPILFEQIAIIPLEDEDMEQQLYAILRPLNLPEFGEDDAVAFWIDIDHETLVPVNEDEMVEQIFSVYDQLTAQMEE